MKRGHGMTTTTGIETLTPSDDPTTGGTGGARTALVATAGVGLVVVLVTALVADLFAAWSSFLGVSLALGNLLVIAKLGTALTQGSGKTRVIWALVGAFKFVLLLLVVALVLRYKAVGAVPLMLGYGALPVGITLSSWLSRFMARQSSQET